MEEDVEVEKGVLVGRVVSVSRQHRDTLEHTGLMRWESSLPLARFLLALPSLTQGLPPCNINNIKSNVQVFLQLLGTY